MTQTVALIAAATVVMSLALLFAAAYGMLHAQGQRSKLAGAVVLTSACAIISLLLFIAAAAGG